MKINNEQPSLIVNTDTAEALIKNGYLDKKTMRLINPDIDWESIRKTMATTVRISCPDNFKALFNILYPIPNKVQEKELDKEPFVYMKPQQDTAEPNGYAKEKYYTKKLSMKDLKA